MLHETNLFTFFFLKEKNWDTFADHKFICMYVGSEIGTSALYALMSNKAKK